VRFLPNVVSRNWPLKLAAFGIALLLWTLVRVDAPNRHVLPNIPVRVVLNDPSWALSGDAVPSSVEVRLSGSTRDLIGVAVDRPSVFIPIDEVTNPDSAVVLRREWLRLDAYQGIVVEDYQPSSVRLAFERVEVATLPIELTVEGALPNGLALAEPLRPEPARARVSGPRSRVAQVESVPLQVLALSRIRESSRFTLGVDTSRLAGLEVSPTSAEVSVVVEEEAERLLPNVPVIPILPFDIDPNGVEVIPASLGVSLRGARSLVEAFDPTRLSLVAAAAGSISPESPEWRVAVVVEGVPELLRARPVEDSVAVRRIPAS
jgi:YbbR domain-containing protein